jgi:hypothetical protein
VPVAFATGSSIFEEPFTYANGNLSDTAAWGAPPIGTSLVVSSNQLTCTASGTGQSNISESSFGDGDYGMTVVTSAGVTRLYACATDLNNAYALFITSPSRLMELYEIVGGVFTLIAGDGATVVDSGDKVGIRRNGSSIAIWHDPGTGWAEIDSATTSTHTSGKVILRSNTTSVVLDDLFVRSLGVIAPAMAALAVAPAPTGVVGLDAPAAAATAAVSAPDLGVGVTTPAMTATAAAPAPTGLSEIAAVAMAAQARFLAPFVIVPTGRNAGPGTAGAGGTRATPGSPGSGSGRSSAGSAGAGGTRSTPGTPGAGGGRG